MTPPDSYQSQRPTDVAWLPSIPAHWSTARGRHIFRIQKRIAGKLGLQVLSVTQTGIKPKDTTTGEGQLSQDYSKYQFVFAGDFVMNHMDLLTGWVDRSGFDGVTSPDYRVFELIDGESDPDFYRLACQVGYIEKLFYAYGQGVSHLGRWRFPADNFKNFVFPKPPLPEQRAAAKAVDRETARIDAMIEKKTRFIWLLKEKRQALITQAVTKGLDPTVPMKDSGVEWIGEVPAHWPLRRLRFVVTFIDGDRGANYPNDKDFVDEGVPFLSSRSLVDNELTMNGVRFITSEKFDSLSRGKLIDGDLIITMRGTIGNTAAFKKSKFGYETAFINAQMMILRANHEVLPDYLMLLSKSQLWREQLDNVSYGTAQQQLSGTELKDLIFPVPDVQEQQKILDLAQASADRVGKLLHTTLKSINLLKERRSALITAAVTGQIDLRGEAA